MPRSQYTLPKHEVLPKTPNQPYTRQPQVEQEFHSIHSIRAITAAPLSTAPNRALRLLMKGGCRPAPANCLREYATSSRPTTLCFKEHSWIMGRPLEHPDVSRFTVAMVPITSLAEVSPAECPTVGRRGDDSAHHDDGDGEVPGHGVSVSPVDSSGDRASGSRISASPSFIAAALSASSDWKRSMRASHCSGVGSGRL